MARKNGEGPTKRGTIDRLVEELKNGLSAQARPKVEVAGQPQAIPPELAERYGDKVPRNVLETWEILKSPETKKSYLAKLDADKAERKVRAEAQSATPAQPELTQEEPFDPHSVPSALSVEEQKRIQEMRENLARIGQIPLESTRAMDVDINGIRAPQYKIRVEMQADMDRNIKTERIAKTTPATAMSEVLTNAKPLKERKKNGNGNGAQKAETNEPKIIPLTPEQLAPDEKKMYEKLHKNKEKQKDYLKHAAELRVYKEKRDKEKGRPAKTIAPPLAESAPPAPVQPEVTAPAQTPDGLAPESYVGPETELQEDHQTQQEGTPKENRNKFLETMAQAKEVFGNDEFAKLAEAGDPAALKAFLDREVPGHEDLAKAAVAEEVKKFKAFQTEGADAGSKP